MPFPSPGDLPDLGIEPMSLMFPALDSLPLSLQGSHAPLFLLSLSGTEQTSQWLRLLAPSTGTLVRSLVRELDLTCHN